jgi:hypothetical protein
MRKSLIAVAMIALAVAGCDNRQDTGTAPVSEAGRGPSPTSVRSSSGAARRAEFLNRIRAADPQYQTIQRAILNEQNELGIILQKDVDLKDIPRLMRSLLTQMAKEYPREDLTVIAYTPTQPPQKIGTGRLDAATREMTYTPVR